ncbi:MAG: GGDEF domain-containing protein [Planctomycetes bacterium]|nr:GGDEF domain-containing protein [Planctomycetota bacterium]
MEQNSEFSDRSDLAVVATEFINAFKDPYTYSYKNNSYLILGFLTGIPVPVCLLLIDVYARELSISFNSITSAYLNRPAHFFFLLSPFIFALIFGALGTVRRLKDDKIWQLSREINLLSVVDATTGIFNRRYFEKRIGSELVRSSRYSRYLSLLIFDIDNFREINEKYGHLQGDAVLVEAANLIKTNTRYVDVLCRYGMDEFAIISPETPGANAKVTAEKIRLIIEEYIFQNISDKTSQIKSTVSVGISDFSDSSIDKKTLIDNADKALAQAKQAGRNRVVLFNNISSSV